MWGGIKKCFKKGHLKFEGKFTRKSMGLRTCWLMTGKIEKRPKPSRQQWEQFPWAQSGPKSTCPQSLQGHKAGPSLTWWKFPATQNLDTMSFPSGLATNIFFCSLFVKKYPRQWDEDFVLFRSFQQLPCLGLDNLKSFLSRHGTLQGPWSSFRTLLPNFRDTKRQSGVKRKLFRFYNTS